MTNTVGIDVYIYGVFNVISRLWYENQKNLLLPIKITFHHIKNLLKFALNLSQSQKLRLVNSLHRSNSYLIKSYPVNTFEND